MSDKPPLDGATGSAGPCCPRCGGTTGYRYTAYVKGEQWNDWGGNGVNFEELDTRHGAYRCQDCNRKVQPNSGLNDAQSQYPLSGTGNDPA